jgi:dTDP-glucose pyrophosphorylase/CBS domain-containing protein
LLLDGCNAKDVQTWEGLVSRAPVPDVYYRPGYVSAYSFANDSEPVAMVIHSGSTTALIPMLIRNFDVGGQSLRDAITPYGYGGLLRLTGPAHPGARVARQIFSELRDWARSFGLVACTLRLHPLFDQEDCWGIQEITNDWTRSFPRGQTTAIELGRWDAARRRLTGMYKGRRYDLKKARLSLQVRISTGPSVGEDLSVFRDLYLKAMYRVRANPFFLFPDEYFETLVRGLGNKFAVVTALHHDHPVASSIFLVDRDFMHYHLACSNDEGRARGASTLLLITASEWGHQRGCTLLHLGGGLQPGDGLWSFKRSFGGPVFQYSYMTIASDIEKYKFLSRQPKTSWPYSGWQQDPSIWRTPNVSDQYSALRPQANGGNRLPLTRISNLAGLGCSIPPQPMESAALPLVSREASIRETMAVIDQYSKGIALIVDESQRLIATVTDGDIRRAILANKDLNEPAVGLKRTHPDGSIAQPFTATMRTSEPEMLSLMQTYSIRQLPLLDDGGRVCALVVIEDLLKEIDLPVTGVIMAGGYGKRLMPLTETVPKPMLPVNGRPLLEHTLDKLRQAGIRSVNVATHYMGERIVEHFNDGSEFGVHLNYFQEKEPLGTAGALAKMDSGTEPLLVINGDILTGVDVRAMLHFHREHNSNLTVAVRQYDIEVPFGVVETDGSAKVAGIKEKPVLRHFINAGIYLIDPAMCRLVPKNHYFDMPDLIRAVIDSGSTVISFPVREYWLDIGQIEQYQKAVADVAKGIV